MLNVKKGKIKYFIIAIIFVTLFILALIILFANNSKGVGAAGISIQEFEKIQLGMTQFEVDSIIDEKDEWDNDEIYDKCCEEISTSNENSVYTYVYKYYGENKGYAIVTYKVDYSDGTFSLKYPEVIKKEQFNLK